MKIKVYSDGGARGNPGPAAVGCVIQISNLKSPFRHSNDKSKCKIFKISKYIGTATNNQAEYQAVIEALKWIKDNQDNRDDQENRENREKQDNQDLEIEFFLDSQLVVEQLNQRFKLKNEGLKPLFWQIRDSVMELGGKVTFKYIPREENTAADRLVNQAIDKAVKSNQNPAVAE